MTQAGSQAAAFYREVVRGRLVWTIFDDGGYPAPVTSSGRAQPFWSSWARAERAIKTPAYRGFEPEEINWARFVGEVLPGLERDGLRVGVNWSGERQIGYDLQPSEVLANLHAIDLGAPAVLASPEAPRKTQETDLLGRNLQTNDRAMNRPRPELRGVYGSIDALFLEMRKLPPMIRLTMSIVDIGIMALAGLSLYLATGSADIGIVAGSVALFISGLWVEPRVLSSSVRQVLGYVLPNLNELKPSWKRISPDDPVPKTPESWATWVARHPVNLADWASIGIHGGFLLKNQRYDDVDLLVERMPTDTPYRRYDHAEAQSWVEYERGGAGDLTEAHRLLGEIIEPRDFDRANFSMALTEGARAIVLGEDWRAPLLAARARLPPDRQGGVWQLGLERLRALHKETASYVGFVALCLVCGHLIGNAAAGIVVVVAVLALIVALSLLLRPLMRPKSS